LQFICARLSNSALGVLAQAGVEKVIAQEYHYFYIHHSSDEIVSTFSQTVRVRRRSACNSCNHLREL